MGFPVSSRSVVTGVESRERDLMHGVSDMNFGLYRIVGYKLHSQSTFKSCPYYHLRAETLAQVRRPTSKPGFRPPRQMFESGGCHIAELFWAV